MTRGVKTVGMNLKNQDGRKIRYHPVVNAVVIAVQSGRHHHDIRGLKIRTTCLTDLSLTPNQLSPSLTTGVVAVRILSNQEVEYEINGRKAEFIVYDEAADWVWE